MRKKLTSTLSTFSAITGSPATTLPGSSEPRLANPTLGAISRVVVSSQTVYRASPCSGRSASGRLRQSARALLKVTQTQLFRFGASSRAPSTLPLSCRPDARCARNLVRLQRDGKRQHRSRRHPVAPPRRRGARLPASASAASWARSGFAVAPVAIRGWRRGRGLRCTAVITPG